MGKRKRLWRHFVLVLGYLFSLIFLFQNCSKVTFNSIGDFELYKTENNGASYDGKPEGQFYHFVPGFTCEQKEAPVASIEILGESITLKENKTLYCASSGQTLDAAAIDWSIYQREIIGYQEGIFEGQDSAPTNIPANLVEIWCRDRKDQQGIESITYYDRASKLAVNRIYYSELGTDGTQTDKVLADFPVARLVGEKSILLKDEKGFELTVHRDQPTPQLGLFVGTLKAVISGEKITRETYCRLGGSVAPSVWPVKQIVDLNVQTLIVSPNQNDFAYRSLEPTGISTLYTAQMDGSHPRKMSLDIAGHVIHYLFTPDSKSLIYRDESSAPKYVRQLYQVNLDGSDAKLLGNTPPKSFNDVSPIKFSRDNRYLLYVDNTMWPPQSAFHEMLNIFSLSDHTRASLSPGAYTKNTRILAFDASVSQSKVVFLYDDGTYSDLYVANLDGTDLKKITPTSVNSSQSDWFITGFTALEVPGGGDFAFVKAHSGLDFKYYMVAIDGSGFVELPVNRLWEFSSPSQEFALLFNSEPLGLNVIDSRRQLMNLKTGTEMELPALKMGIYGVDLITSWIFSDAKEYPLDQWDKNPVFFSKDSKTLIGSEVLKDGQYQGVAIDTADGKVTRLCPGVVSPQMMIRELSENKFLILSHDKNAGILNVFLKERQAPCTKVNSVSIENSVPKLLVDLTISPDQKKILVLLGVSRPEANLVSKSTLLLYVPLDGKPAHLVNSPVFTEAFILHSSFSADSKNVIYVGDQIKAGISHVFRWTAPQ